MTSPMTQRLYYWAATAAAGARVSHVLQSSLSSQNRRFARVFIDHVYGNQYRWNKQTQQKVRRSKFIFKMSTNHANTYAFKRLPVCHCAIAAAMTVCMVQQPPLPQHTFFQLLHIMDPRAVDPLLKRTPDAVVHRIQIWRIRWPHLWRDKLWHLSLQHGDSVTCMMCWCLILLKNVVIPENRADIQQKHI